jgi:hypothetical protein
MSLEFPPDTFTPLGYEWIKDMNDTIVDDVLTGTFVKYKTVIHNAPHGNGTYVAWANSIYSYVHGTSYGAGEWPASGAFDKRNGDSGSRGGWHTNTVNVSYTNYSASDHPTPAYLAFTIPTAIKIGSYSIQARPGCCSVQLPSKWTLYGSHNAQDWVSIHTIDNETGWSLAETRTYTVTGTHVYKHFKWIWLRNNNSPSVHVSTLRVFGDILDISPGENPNLGRAVLLGSDTNGPYELNGYSVRSSSHYISGVAGDVMYFPYLAFNKTIENPHASYFNDRPYEDAWMSHSSAAYPHWLEIQYPSAVRVTYYSITSCHSFVTPPNDWTMQGSSDGSTWTVLDTRTGQGADLLTPLTTKMYTVTPDHSHIYFRLHITDSTADTGSSTNIAQWRLFTAIGIDSVNHALMLPPTNTTSLQLLYTQLCNNTVLNNSISLNSFNSISLYRRWSFVEPCMVDLLTRGWTLYGSGADATMDASGKGIVIAHTAPFFITTQIPFMNGVFEIDFEYVVYAGRNHYKFITVHDGSVTQSSTWYPNGPAYAMTVDAQSPAQNNTVVTPGGLYQSENISGQGTEGVNTQGIKYKAVMELNLDRGIFRTYFEGKEVQMYDYFAHTNTQFTSPALGVGVDNITNGTLKIHEIRARPILQDVWSFYEDFGSLPTLSTRHAYKDGMTNVYRPMWSVSDVNMVTLGSEGITIDNSTITTGFFMTTRIPMQDGVWILDFTLNATFPTHININIIHGGDVTGIGGTYTWNPNHESYVHVNDTRVGGDNNMCVTNSSGTPLVGYETNNNAEASSSGRYTAILTLNRSKGVFSSQIIGKTLVSLNQYASQYNFSTPYIGFGFDYVSQGSVTLHNLWGYSINAIAVDIGTTPENPAPSAWFLKHVIGHTGQGVFYIRPPGSSDTIRTLCLFDVFGGGWTCFLAGSYDSTYGVYGEPSNTLATTIGNIFNSYIPFGTQDPGDVIASLTLSTTFTIDTFATPKTWYKNIPKRNTNREYFLFVTGNSSGEFDTHSLNNHAWLRPTLDQDFFEIGAVGQMGIDTPSIKVRSLIPPNPRWWSPDIHMDMASSGLTPTLTSEDAFGHPRLDPTHFTSGQYLLKFVR